MTTNGDTPEADHEHDHPDEGVTEVETAFVVIVRADALSFATSDLQMLTKVSLRREATLADFYRSSCEVANDVGRQQTVQNTMDALQQYEDMKTTQAIQKKNTRRKTRSKT